MSKQERINAILRAHEERYRLLEQRHRAMRAQLAGILTGMRLEVESLERELQKVKGTLENE